MTYVYVISKSGKPLAPTARCGHVRILLKQNKAKVVSTRPFVIKLKYDTPEIVPTLYGGTDPGRTNLGNAVADENGDCVYLDKIETRNKDVVKGMSNRKTQRKARKRGARLKKKRRAKKYGTLSTKLENGRLIPGTTKPTPVKDIKNKESRFQHRKKRQLISPSVRQLVETHLNHVDQICKLLPIKKWCLEANKFAFMKMEDGTVQGVDFQNGRLKGYKNADEFVYERQDGKCFCCGKPIEHYHHIKPRSEGGSDGPENKIGVCNECHSKIHTGELDLDIKGYNKKYAALSVLNQAIPYIYKGLVECFGEENVLLISGRDTKDMRDSAGLEKDHDVDALCIASFAAGVTPKKPEVRTFKVKQFRRHDRAKISSQPERTYKLDGKTVAKNRKPRFKQEGPALSQWYEEQVEIFGKKEADRMLSRLKVKKSYRRYNNTERVMPGALIRHNGRMFILTSQENNGRYYKVNGKRVPAKECKLLKQNHGLVYM